MRSREVFAFAATATATATANAGESFAMPRVQRHDAVALDIVPAKAEKLSRQESPIEDSVIESFSHRDARYFRATPEQHEADVVVANRRTGAPTDEADKVYTRDLFGGNRNRRFSSAGG